MPTETWSGPDSNRWPRFSREQRFVQNAKGVCSCASRPSGVSRMPRLSRSTSGPPNEPSSSRIWSESAGCETWTLSGGPAEGAVLDQGLEVAQLTQGDGHVLSLWARPLQQERPRPDGRRERTPATMPPDGAKDPRQGPESTHQDIS